MFKSKKLLCGPEFYFLQYRNHTAVLKMSFKFCLRNLIIKKAL